MSVTPMMWPRNTITLDSKKKKNPIYPFSVLFIKKEMMCVGWMCVWWVAVKQPLISIQN